MQQRGFSLLELILVITIIALAYALLPRFVFNGVSGAELKSNARQVAAALRQARNTALNTRREAFLTLDMEKREFTLTNDSRAYKLNEQVDLKLYTAEADIIDAQKGTIRFFPDGSSNGGQVTIAAGERKYFVNVDWLTGTVSIADKPEAEKHS